MKNPCFAIPFGAANLVFGLILLIMASFALGGDTAQDLAFNGLCTPAMQDRTELSGFDKAYMENVDKVMCTDTCPC